MRTSTAATCDRLKRRSAGHGFGLFPRSAEHGFTFRVRSAEHGFTLVELMVVLVIIGLASAAVLLTSGPPDGRLSDDADRFALKVGALRDDAIVSRRPAALWITASGYGFERRESGAWQPRDDKPFTNIMWKPGVSVQVSGGTAAGGRASIVFDNTGVPDNPGRVVLSRGVNQVTVTIDGTGDVRVDR